MRDHFPAIRRGTPWIVGVALFSSAGLWAAGWDQRAAKLRKEPLQTRFEALRPLFEKKRAPGPSDWLANHPEPGQSFFEYTASNPVRPGNAQTSIDVVPLGHFSTGQQRVLDLTLDYVSRYFGLQVRVLPPRSTDDIPADAQRVHPTEHQTQLLTGHILDEILFPVRSKDAVATVAFTGVDLYPEESWNFVFGQASLNRRVGVWSLHRFGNPDASEAEFTRVLRRSIKTAVHELGHMFSLPHCVAYECVMNGSNHADEAEHSPIEPCPICLQKLCWDLGCDPVARATRLQSFARANGLTSEARLLSKERAILVQQPLPP